jgi:UDP-glucose 4-epimerase
MVGALPKRVVVTGGAGFIGCHSVEALLAGGARVLVIDDLRHASDRPLPAEAELEAVDVAGAPAHDVIQRFRPDAILHLAAQGGVNRSWRDPLADAATNVLGTVNLLQSAADSGCTRVVLASSGGALYGDTSRIPTPEDQAVAPRSPYGCAKACCEVYLEMFARSHRICGTALRYSNVYGPGQDGTGEAGVVAISSVRLVRGRPPVVRGDGSQTRDFVYVGDVVDANIAALARELPGAFNIGTGVETSIATVVAELCGAARFAGDPEREPAPMGEVRRSALDTQKAFQELGWSAGTRVSDGLRRTYEHFHEALAVSGSSESATEPKAGRAYRHRAIPTPTRQR